MPDLLWFNEFVLRACAKITSQNWRPDLDQIFSIRNRKATGIAGLFRGFCGCGSDKDGLKMGCENVKLFLREPLVGNHPFSLFRCAPVFIGVNTGMRTFHEIIVGESVKVF